MNFGKREHINTIERFKYFESLSQQKKKKSFIGTVSFIRFCVETSECLLGHGARFPNWRKPLLLAAWGRPIKSFASRARSKTSLDFPFLGRVGWAFASFCRGIAEKDSAAANASVSFCSFDYLFLSCSRECEGRKSDGMGCCLHQPSRSRLSGNNNNQIEALSKT